MTASREAGAGWRMAIAATSLVSGLVALYLHLWKMGRVGELSCGGGIGCMVAQFSSYGWFLGVDVALVGTVGYALIFIVAMIGVQSRFESATWPTMLLILLSVGGFLFTLRLKYGEFIVLKTFCPWCAISAVAITLCTVFALLDWRRLRQAM
ncbi:MAG TPA: vitamin K epoxide reductase family protein [Gemmatimonadales bacterium]|nr:vitamin K epoxide reductase family protein [Gemmatimonadales bacterium]